MKKLQTSLVTAMLVVAVAAAALNLYRVLLPQEREIRCMLQDFQETPGTASIRLARAVLNLK